MSLQTYLEDLRTRPEHIRNRYAIFSSLGVTVVIFAFWLHSFSFFNNVGTQTAVAAAIDKTGTPGQSLIAGVGSFFTDIKDIVFGAKKVTYTNVEVRPGKR